MKTGENVIVGVIKDIYIMYKIEWQPYGGGKKSMHRLYEGEKAFETYWKHHCETANVFGGYRLVGFKDSVEIRHRDF